MTHYLDNLEVSLHKTQEKLFLHVGDPTLDVLIVLTTENIKETLEKREYKCSYISLANRVVEAYGNPEVTSNKKQKAMLIADYLLDNLDKLNAILVKEML